jgi:hypothetical protein
MRVLSVKSEPYLLECIVGNERAVQGESTDRSERVVGAECTDDRERAEMSESIEVDERVRVYRA